jgi:hypothetical protein
MKVGDRFRTVKAFEQILGINFPRRGFLMGSHIKHLPGHSDYCCSRQNFYPEQFPEGNQMWWNEFEGVTKAETLRANWNDSNWLKKTEIVHEIYSPLEVPTKPGAEKKNKLYHPVNIISDDCTKRLILGRLPQGYVFLGVYELQKEESLAFCNSNGYRVDAVSFPSNIIVAAMRANSDFPEAHKTAIQSNLITYPHSVWKRISNVWGE